MGKLKHKIVSQQDINNIKKGGNGSYVYDPSNRPLNFVDTGKLADELIVIFTYLNRPEVKKLKNKEEYKEHLGSKFENFSNRHPSIFKLIVKGEDISHLFELIRMADKIKNKKMSKKKKDKLSRKMIGKFLKKNIVDPQLNKNIQKEEESEDED
uniref:Uncharacterized protein n=1 Tax=Mimivirus LCMiAC02 TaxID=2506609 RepID=A0A481Z1E9_9VIRU|nr:MAG: hypothetical protein LCMiAC02_01430 [Mimivirus LCMiAC02]